MGPQPDATGRTAALLVTGGSGFIGSRFIEEYRQVPGVLPIVNLDLLPGPGIHIECDIRQPIDVEQLADYDFAACVHLAALAKEPGYEVHEYYDTNVDGTEHVLNLCRSVGIDHVVFTSTMMVFAPTDERRAETDIPDPNTHYGKSKLKAERLIKAFLQEAPDRRVGVNLRPAVVFGPNDIGNFERLRKQVDRNAFVYIGRRTTVKSCVHVDDVSGFICWLLQHPHPPGHLHQYHVAIPTEVTIEQIVTAIQTSFGSRRTNFPIVPFSLARALSLPFVGLSRLGLETGIHPRRIEKLFESTNISADPMTGTAYDFRYRSLEAAVEAWASHA